MSVSFEATMVYSLAVHAHTHVSRLFRNATLPFSLPNRKSKRKALKIQIQYRPTGTKPFQSVLKKPSIIRVRKKGLKFQWRSGFLAVSNGNRKLESKRCSLNIPNKPTNIRYKTGETISESVTLS